jgi:hypothetical protein
MPALWAWQIVRLAEAKRSDLKSLSDSGNNGSSGNNDVALRFSWRGRKFADSSVREPLSFLECVP